MESYDLWKLTPPEVASHPCKVCQFDVYKDSELCEDCQKEEENEMITTKNPVEMIKEELCSRYGINPEQIAISVDIDNLESTELADKIKNDYEVKGKVLDFLKSHKGYNQHLPEINFHAYIVCADHGTRAKKENILNMTIRTKNGVIKNE